MRQVFSDRSLGTGCSARRHLAARSHFITGFTGEEAGLHGRGLVECSRRGGGWRTITADGRGPISAVVVVSTKGGGLGGGL